MFQITVLFLYIIAGFSIALSRWPGYANREQLLVLTGIIAGVAGLLWHAYLLWIDLALATGVSLSIGNTVSFVGMQLALIALLGTLEPTLRGLCGGLLLLAGLCAGLTDTGAGADAVQQITWQIQAHVLISLFAYGLLTAGAIVALYALVQDRRLRTARLSPVNQLFAPLETTETLLFSVTMTGFTTLVLAIVTGLAFVENLFAQHLVHKTVLSMVAWIAFGVLLWGRYRFGWRGRKAIRWTLVGFVVLMLAYFGSKAVIELILQR